MKLVNFSVGNGAPRAGLLEGGQVFEAPRPTVTLDGTAADRVTLTVASGGPPIPPEVMAELFRPFATPPRAPGSPRRQIGLGLFVVHELVVAHGGTVEGTSAQDGTRFVVSLPRAAVTGP